MTKFKTLLTESSAEATDKRVLVNRIHKAFASPSKGLHRDTAWQAVWNTLGQLDKLNLDWNTTDSYYGNHKHDHTMPPERKTWKFEVDFTNKRGKKQKLYGTLTAHGAGKMDDPLDKYDITFTIG